MSENKWGDEVELRNKRLISQIMKGNGWKERVGKVLYFTTLLHLKGSIKINPHLKEWSVVQTERIPSWKVLDKKLKQDNLKICNEPSRRSASTLKTKLTRQPKTVKIWKRWPTHHLKYSVCNFFYKAFIISCNLSNSNTRNNDWHHIHSGDKENEGRRIHACSISQGHPSQ